MTFAKSLTDLCSRELAEGSSDTDRMADMLERLISCAALCIAITTRGNTEGMNSLAEGSAAHLFECVSDSVGIGKLMKGIL